MSGKIQAPRYPCKLHTYASEFASKYARSPIRLAYAYASRNTKPSVTRVHEVHEGLEPPDFRSCFHAWNRPSPVMFSDPYRPTIERNEAMCVTGRVVPYKVPPIRKTPALSNS
eukprot:104148_1